MTLFTMLPKPLLSIPTNDFRPIANIGRQTLWCVRKKNVQVQGYMRNIKFVWAQSGTSCTAKRTNIPLFHAPRPLSITLGTRTWLHKCLLSSHSFELEGGRYERKARQQRCFPTLRGMDSLLTSLVIYFLFECAHVLHATDFFSAESCESK